MHSFFSFNYSARGNSKGAAIVLMSDDAHLELQKLLAGTGTHSGTISF